MEKLEMLLALFAVCCALALPVILPLLLVYYVIVFILAGQNDIDKKTFLLCMIPFWGVLILARDFYKDLK
jgi:hypothetical protein